MLRRTPRRRRDPVAVDAAVGIVAGRATARLRST
jgi:hypothetical protein